MQECPFLIKLNLLPISLSSLLLSHSCVCRHMAPWLFGFKLITHFWFEETGSGLQHMDRKRVFPIHPVSLLPFVKTCLIISQRCITWIPELFMKVNCYTHTVLVCAKTNYLMSVRIPTEHTPLTPCLPVNFVSLLILRPFCLGDLLVTCLVL